MVHGRQRRLIVVTEIGNYYFEPCTNEILCEYRTKGELSFLWMDCPIPDIRNGNMQTFCVYRNCSSSKGILAAFITLSNMVNALVIDEFEVVQSMRGQGIGTEIICSVIQIFPKVSCIKAIPNDFKAELFWRHCGFTVRKGEYMIWTRDHN